MVAYSLNNKLIVSSINNNYKFIFFGLILIIYFAWMDIALFLNLQRWSPPGIEIQEANKFSNLDDRLSNISEIAYTKNGRIRYTYSDPFSVFKPLSVKLIMIDHATHYVHDILARFLEDTLHFTQIFPWITANFVSFVGLIFAFIGSRLIISNNIFYCQLGAILFELRNLADSLDGVVYRSRLRRFEQENSNKAQIGVYQSNYGSLGYNVDVICDGLGGLFFCIAIFIKFLKHLPTKNMKSRLLISNGIKNQNYKYLKLENVNYVRKESNDLISNIDYTIDLNDPINRNDHDNNLDINTSIELNEEKDQFFQKRHFSSRQVKQIVVFFGLRLLFTGLIWDHYVHKYHDLLMVFSKNPNKRKLQAQAFKSISMWLIMWFWRLGNACAILEHLVITTFFNKLWDYLVFTSYLGWAYLIILTFFTQVHYTELYETLDSFAVRLEQV